MYILVVGSQGEVQHGEGLVGRGSILQRGNKSFSRKQVLKSGGKERQLCVKNKKLPRESSVPDILVVKQRE